MHTQHTHTHCCKRPGQTAAMGLFPSGAQDRHRPPPAHTRLPVPGLPSEDLVMLILLSLTYLSGHFFLPLLLWPTEGRDINESIRGARKQCRKSWSTLGYIWRPTSPLMSSFLGNPKTRLPIVYSICCPFRRVNLQLGVNKVMLTV